jgi:translation initiation factor IF-3
MFRGREVTHPERGTALLDKLSGELSEIAVIEQSPLQDGRNMTMMLAPSKSVLAGEHDKNGVRVHTDEDAPATEAPGDGEAPATEAPSNEEAPAAEASANGDSPSAAQDDEPAPAPSDATA